MPARFPKYGGVEGLHIEFHIRMCRKDRTQRQTNDFFNATTV